MRRPSDLVSREPRHPFLSLFIDIAALLLFGGISTGGLWMLFAKPIPAPERDTVGEERAKNAKAPAAIRRPTLREQTLGLANIIQSGQPDEVAAPLLGLILAELADARVRGESPEEFLRTAFAGAELRAPHTEWVRDCVLMNWSAAHEFGLLTPENLSAMRRCNPPRVTVGSYRGEAMEIVLQPVNDAPYRVPAALPKLVPARLARSLATFAKNEALRGVPPQVPQPSTSSTRPR
jgi:hypothetical protein